MDLAKINEFVSNYSKYLDIFYLNHPTYIAKPISHCEQTVDVFRCFLSQREGKQNCKTYFPHSWFISDVSDSVKLNMVEKHPIYQVIAGNDDVDEDGDMDGFDHKFFVINQNIRLESWLHLYEPKITIVDNPMDHFKNFWWYTIEVPDMVGMGG